MKHTLVRAALLATVALFAFGCTANRTGVVNTELVYQKSAASEKGTEYIKAVTAELEKELRTLEEKSASAKDKKASQAELQQALMGIQQRFNAEQQQVVTILSDAYKSALETCRTKYNLDIILSTETVLSHAPGVDVTEKVMAEMNALPLEFKPLNAETSATPTASTMPAMPAAPAAQ